MARWFHTGDRGEGHGAPLHMVSWLEEARYFLSRHRSALEEMPVADRALGPTEDKEKDRQDA